MHFLSHFFVEQVEQGPYFTLGLIMPDLTTSFSKYYNSTISKNTAPEQEELRLIHQGILQHYTGDKWFHQSAAFNDAVTQSIHHFTRAGLNRNRLRLSVIAHLTMEMMIDRQIVLYHTELCDTFYQEVNHIEEDVIDAFFAYYKLNIVKNNFLPKFQFFRRRKYLYLFTELENLIVGLNRIYGSATKIEFTNAEKTMLLAALHNIDNELRYSWQEILKR